MKVLIIDDEPLPAKYLEELLNQNCDNITSIKIINNPIEGLIYIDENEIDLLFLDVEMPRMTGVELVKNANLKDTTSIVFTTAYEEYALDAFKVNASHYLVKPVEIDELKSAVEKVYNYQQLIKEKEEPKIEMIKLFDGEIYRKVDYSKIIRFQAEGSYTQVHLESECFLVTKRLGEILKELIPGTFIRSHNSHIINLNKIKGIQKTKLLINLTDKSEVPFSNTYRKEVLNWFDK